MSRSYMRVYVHLVWATWDRLPLLTDDIQSKMFACIAAKARELNCEVLALGGVEDHVHVLVWLPSVLAVPTLVRELKGASSHLANHGLGGGGSFKWQGSYSALSVGSADVHRVAAYIRRQKEHHAARQLRDEWEAHSDQA